MLYRLYVGLGWASEQHQLAELDNLAKHWANTAFGGFTRYEAEGGWVNPNGTGEIEPTDVWEIYTHDRLAVGQFRDYLAALYYQEKVLVLEFDAQEVGE